VNIGGVQNLDQYLSPMRRRRGALFFSAQSSSLPRDSQPNDNTDERHHEDKGQNDHRVIKQSLNRPKRQDEKARHHEEEYAREGPHGNRPISGSSVLTVFALGKCSFGQITRNIDIAWPIAERYAQHLDVICTLRGAVGFRADHNREFGAAPHEKAWLSLPPGRPSVQGQLNAPHELGIDGIPQFQQLDFVATRFELSEHTSPCPDQRWAAQIMQAFDYFLCIHFTSQKLTFHTLARLTPRQRTH
jgi:hypothetical protein